MVKVILGKKGTGKTKALIEMVNKAAAEENGSVVCIEYGDKLKLDISHKARLIDITNYPVNTNEGLEGFISGLFAGNYDISNVYVDSLLKIVGEDLEALGAALAAMEELTKANHATLVCLVSADVDTAPESVKKYM
ncbi:MAG: hypothetical protein DBX52_02230 [Clostridiales bacterium]|mgnify:CR=1 FL=1|nr:MAG: hypothetical protein DBX52_02230 [Clostridiales bacterium]